MSSAYDWSKVAANNANSDSGINWVEGQLPGTVNGSARAMMGRVAEFIGDTAGALTAGGTANAQTVTANSAFTAYANGLVIALKIATSNTTAATLNVNGLGAKSIRKMIATGESALAGGELQATGIYWLMYSTALNAAAGGWLLLNPTTSAIVATTGTFSGAISATTGTFSGAVNTSGDITASSADVIASNFLVGASGIYAKAAAGTMLFRPNGKASATGQVSLDATGAVAIGNDTTISGGQLITDIGRFTTTALHVGKTSGSLATTGVSFFATGASNGLFQCTRDHAVVGQYNVINPVGTETVLEFMTSGTAKGSITINGSTTAYNTTSDRRLKENPRPFDAGSIIDRLKVYQFDWKAGGSGYGVFAQEAVKVFPDAVTKGKGKTTWKVDYSKFTPLLLQEVKELREEIRRLKDFLVI